MPRFAYLAVDPRGRERRGIVQANDAGAARASLESRKLYILKLAAGGHEQTAARKLDWLPDFLTAKRLSAKQLTLFTRQLATMTKVSPLEESLRIISRQSEQEHVRTAVARVADGAHVRELGWQVGVGVRHSGRPDADKGQAKRKQPRSDATT